MPALTLPRLLPATLVLALALPACQRQADTAALLNEARAYRKQGDHAAAVIQLKNAIVGDPRHAQARRLLGEVYLEQGDAASAEKELGRALDLGAPADQLQVLLARSWLMQQQFERLLAQTDAAGIAPLLALRGDAQLGLGRAQDARLSYEAALARDGACTGALLGLARLAAVEQRMAEAQAHVERALANAPFDIDSLRLEGDLLRLEGKPDAAMQSYRKILQLRPNHPQALVDSANLHIDAGRLAEARRDIALARRASPQALAVHHAQAFLDYREGKLKQALAGVQHILGSAPGHLPTVLLAGAIESALGAHEQASAHLRQFLDANPRHAYASKALAVLYLREKQPHKASALLRPLLESQNGDVELLTLAGEARLRAQDYEAAAALFETASKLRPEAAMLHAGVAMGRLGAGETGRALAEFEHAAALDRQSQRTGLMLAMAYLRAGDGNKALEAVHEMAREGDGALVQNLLGGVYLSQHEVAKARASFERALVFDQAYVPALDNLAQLDVLEGLPGQARLRYEAALAKSPANTALMQACARHLLARGETKPALAWLENAHAAAPDAPGPAVKLAALYIRAGQQEKGLALARQVQARHPGDPEALALLAQMRHRIGEAGAAPAAPLQMAHAALLKKDRSAAMGHLRKALAADPANDAARHRLVQLLIEARHFEEAGKLVRQARQSKPDAAAGHALEGDLLRAQGKCAAAVAAYERALRLAPSGAVLAQLFQALNESGQQARADARMRAWLVQHPDDAATRLYFASAKLVAGELAAAITELDAVLKREPANVIALNDLAWAHQRTAPRTALAYAQRAHRLAPDNAAVLDTLGWILLEDGKLARALPLLKRARELAPDAAEIVYHYGVALARSGDKPGARREIGHALATRQPFASRAAASAALEGL